MIAYCVPASLCGNLEVLGNARSVHMGLGQSRRIARRTARRTIRRKS